MHGAYVLACVRMNCVAQLYHDQIMDGIYFQHEHPKFASSWTLECVKRLQMFPGVTTVRADQCHYGAVALHGPHKASRLLKPTGFMSNSCMIFRALSRTCGASGGRCSRFQGGRQSAETAMYTRAFRRVILHGLTAQLQADGQLHDGCYGLMGGNRSAAPS